MVVTISEAKAATRAARAILVEQLGAWRVETVTGVAEKPAIPAGVEGAALFCEYVPRHASVSSIG